MAEETDIALKIAIDASASADSVKELRKSLKELIDLQGNVSKGTPEWKKLSHAINETEGKIGDLNDSFQTLRGSGIERTENSFNLLKEGFTKFDTGKIKAGISGIGAAFKAIPIFLVVEGIRFLIEKFDELKNSGGLVGKVFSAIGKTVDLLIEGIEYLADKIGLIDLKEQNLAKTRKKAYEDTQKAIEKQSQAYDDQIAIASAAGKNTVDLEIAKQKAIIETNKKIVEQELALIQSSKSVTQEQIDRVNKSIDAINKAVVSETIIIAKDQKTKNDNYKKYLDDKRKVDDDAFWADIKAKKDREEKAAAEEALAAAYFEQQKINAVNNAVMSDEEIQAAKDARALSESAQRQAKELADAKEARDKRIALFKEGLDETLKLSAATEQAISNISSAFFEIKRNNVKKNSEEERALARKQFDLSKKMQIAQAVISGITGVINILGAKSVVPEPFGSILKGIQAASFAGATAASIAKIDSMQFDASRENIGVPSGSSGGAAGAGLQPPVVQSPQNSQTNVNPDGSIGKQTVKAIVVETDITDKQKKVNTIKETATF